MPDRILIRVTLAPDGKSFRDPSFFYESFVDGAYTHGNGYGDMTGWRLALVPRD